jgi:hypothetical protein
VAVRNIARGGGKAFKTEVTGLKELEKKLKALKGDNPQLVSEMYEVVGAAAEEVRDSMKASARAAGWGGERATVKTGRGVSVVSGQEAIASIFAFDKPRGGNSKKRISALAGAGKKRTMIEWRAGRHPKSPRAKVAPGGKVAMSLVSMLEFGTTNRRARPAIRQAIAGAKSRIISRIADGYKTLLAKYSK